MSEHLIEQYYARLEKVIQYSGSHNETALRSAFENLINGYCESKNLLLINELELRTPSGITVIPDGTIKDALRLDWGYWESKDEYDDLDAEIRTKFAKGYPNSNILFEDSKRAVLYQSGAKVMDVSVRDPEKLDEIIRRFLSYERPEVKSFREAIEKFRTDLPTILNTLRDKIAEESRRNPQFQTARDTFLTLCREAINPQITPEDVREMMIQHILTEEIFLSVFNESQFHRENNIAGELQKVVETFFTGYIRKNILAGIENYYLVIKNAAAGISNHHEKQRFLKALYENFYKIYNPKAADRLGVFYTPNEIVRFMIESTDYLLNKCFGKRLSDPGVHILDPATGTGTFITELIEYLPKTQLPHKFADEIHCNEVSILPYYIANLNIEFTYKQKMGQYVEFKHICFMDTLDHATFSQKQTDMFSVTVENTERIRNQNQQDIFVIIGNPPYNANQQNENENNKNREYDRKEGIDNRIKVTYIKESTAQKTKLYDMYARFLRWATDRIAQNKNGIVAFVSNSSFIDARTFDGFRKVVAKEFNEIHIIDLKGNARNSGERRRREGGNIFSDKIKVGVAVYFLVKKEGETGCKIWYHAIDDYLKEKEKKAYVSQHKFQDLNFALIIPDKDNNWINLTDNDFDELLPLTNKETKLGKAETAVFKLFSLGVVTNRDEWVYDFSEKKLEERMNYFFDIYESEMKRISDKDIPDENLSKKIKWTRDLKKSVRIGINLELENNKIVPCFYRPYIKKLLYYDKYVNEMRYQMPIIFPNGKENENLIISVNVANSKNFNIISSNCLVDLHFNGDSACLPFYRYESGSRIDNITDWGLNQFISNYDDPEITKEDIFHYVYAVLHNPEYRRKYEQNLKRELPRIPFYEDFHQWAAWGKELMNLHISFETVEPYPLERRDLPAESPQPKLKADKENGAIIIDTATTLYGVPKIVWEYRLGTYSALQWILEQYKEKKIKDPTVAELFDNYRFADYKEYVIDLLMRVCTVSVKTMEIVGCMSLQEGGNNACCHR